MPEMQQQDIKDVKYLLSNRYMEAVHSNDPRRYASLFTLKGMWMPPGSAPVSGRSAIEEAERHIFSVASLKISSKIVEVSIDGDTGWALGEIDGTKTPHDSSEPTRFLFRLIWIVIKERSEWKIHRQLWNQRPSEDAEAYQL